MKRFKWLSIALAASLLTLSSLTIASAAVKELPSNLTVGYSSPEIKSADEVISTRDELINALNYNITQMNSSFEITIKDYDASILPKRVSELEFGFVKKLSHSKPENDDNGLTTIKYTVTYNDAGKVVLDMLHDQPLNESDTKALELKAAAEGILNGVESSSDYEKIVALHDALVLNCSYDTQLSKDSETAYGALVAKKAEAKGYASALQLLYTLAGIENRMVLSYSIIGSGEDMDIPHAHYFNKVNLDGEWYNVDATVNDPLPNSEDGVKRDYLLVSDDVSSQRYVWEESRYPAAETENNWHHRNNLVASSQEELEKLVNEATAKKEKYFSVWVNDYSSETYSVTFAKEIKNVENVTVTTTAATGDYDSYATSLSFTFEYK